MTTLVCVCESYSGWVDNEVITVTEGQHFEVPAERAEQLLGDFPHWFQKPKAQAATPAPERRAQAPAAVTTDAGAQTTTTGDVAGPKAAPRKRRARPENRA